MCEDLFGGAGFSSFGLLVLWLITVYWTGRLAYGLGQKF